MARNDRYVDIGPLKGQNSTENPLSLGPEWAIACRNITLRPASSVLTKRRGSIPLAGTPIGTYLVARHKPAGGTEADAELWAFCAGPAGQTVFRKVGAAAFEPIPVPPTIHQVLRTVSFNGKLFFAAVTTDNRLYVWDGSVIRAVGIMPSSAPTTTPGTGSVTRHYKVDWVRLDGTGRVQARSELSPAVQVTTTGTTATTIHRPAPAGTNATHWRVWVSMDGALFRNASGNLPVATTTFADNNTTGTYTGEYAPEVGTYLTPPTAQRIITDGNRLLMAHSVLPTATIINPGETAPRKNRVWYTPVLGSSDQADDERIPQTSAQRNFLDLGEHTEEGITELGGPVSGNLYAATLRRLWRLIPTGDLATPYLLYTVSDVYGAVIAGGSAGQGMVTGEDHGGNPALYFLAETGVYRVSTRVEYVSYDIEADYQTSGVAFPFLFVWPAERQLWLVTTVGEQGSQYAVIYVFHWDQGYPDQNGDVIGGWSIWHVGPGSANMAFQSGVLHNRTPGDYSNPALTLVPYLSRTTDGVSDWPVAVFDQPAATDYGVPYAASATFAAIMPTGTAKQFRAGNPVVIAQASTTPLSLAVGAVRDFGTETRSATISLQPLAHEANPNPPSHVVRTVEGLFAGDVTSLRMTLGDVAPTAELWRVDRFIVPTSEQEPR